MTVETISHVIAVPDQLLADFPVFDPFRKLTPKEQAAAARAHKRRQAADAKRTDCGCVLRSPGEGLDEIGECELPAGHAGDHVVTVSWSRSDYDRRGEWQEFPVPDEVTA